MTVIVRFLSAAKQHVQRNADDGDRSHRHTSHVEVDRLWHQVMNLPDAADRDAHDSQESVVSKHETQNARNDDNQWPPVLEKLEIVDPAHDG